MNCKHNWTIRFPTVNVANVWDIFPDAPDPDAFEIRPRTFSLSLSRKRYDFARAECHWKVGEEMKPHTRYKDGNLYGNHRAVFLYNGNPIQHFLFKPDFVNYEDNATHLEFHDLHSALSEGIVNIQRRRVELRDIYKEVLNSVDNDFIQDIKFTNLPDDQYTIVYFGNADDIPDRRGQDAIQINGEYAVDFNDISPEEAVRRLNNLYGLKSWVNREGNFIVGHPEDEPQFHIAAPDDQRVWRYKDPSLTHSTDPIQSVYVKGPWEDRGGLNADPRSWFDEGGMSDVRLYGIAHRDDIDYGRIVHIEHKDVSKYSVDEYAKAYLKEKHQEQQSGTVEIDPQLSGSEQSRLINITPGDTLRLVPNDKFFNNPTKDSGQVGDEEINKEEMCGSFVHNDDYMITEVEHNLTEAGSWQVFADVKPQIDFSVSTEMKWFDPSHDEVGSDVSALRHGQWFEGK